MTAGRPRLDRKCTVEGCDEKHYAKGYCNRHYQNWRNRNGGYKPKFRHLNIQES